MAMEDDREWNRIEQELKRQPEVNRAAIASILMEIRRPRPQPWPLRAWAWVAEPRLSISPIGAFAAAALIVVTAVAISGRAGAGSATGRPAGELAAVPPATTVLPASSGARRQEVQFVLVDNSASDVRIVG